MKIITQPEFNLTVKDTYLISQTSGYFEVKRKKDVINYYFRLQNQSNDYMKYLIQTSGRIDSYISENISSFNYQQIATIYQQKTNFFERLKWLAFADYVCAVFKTNALYNMNKSLQRICLDTDNKKLLKELRLNETEFFDNHMFFIKDTIVIKSNKFNYAKSTSFKIAT